ncbi:MAG: hypothetical protein AABX94_04555 [Nanoarchaeota archaeon]|mgnify:CR=1 FL=1
MYSVKRRNDRTEKHEIIRIGISALIEELISKKLENETIINLKDLKKPDFPEKNEKVPSKRTALVLRNLDLWCRLKMIASSKGREVNEFLFNEILFTELKRLKENGDLNFIYGNIYPSKLKRIFQRTKELGE